MSNVNEGIDLWTLACLIRDNYTCQICGMRACEVHHAVHRSGINRLMMENGVSVCRPCHLMDGHPTLCEPFRDKVIRVIGPERFQQIKVLTNTCAQFDKDVQIRELKEYIKAHG